MMTVHPLVLGFETRRGGDQRVGSGHTVEWNAQLRALTAVAEVKEPLEHHAIRRVPFADQPRSCSILERVQTSEDNSRRRASQLPTACLHELVPRLGVQQTKPAKQARPGRADDQLD